MVAKAVQIDGQVQKQGFALWLLLLAIFTHALLPGDSPLQRTTGSAFDSSTIDVALAPTRNALAEEPLQVRSGKNGTADGGFDSGSSALVPFSAALPAAPAPTTSHAASQSNPKTLSGSAWFNPRAPPGL